jgi:hypothetical protein
VCPVIEGHIGECRQRGGLATFDLGGEGVQPLFQIGVSIAVIIAIRITWDRERSLIFRQIRPSADVVLTIDNLPRSISNALDNSEINLISISRSRTGIG